MALILVVDDDHIISQLLAEEFTRHGHHSVTANSVASARRTAAARHPDVVFLDVQLPDGSGLDIIGELKETPAKPEVVIFTGFGNPEGAEMAIRNGAWDYLEKPISMDRLHLALSRALEYRKQKKKAGRVSVVLDRGQIMGDSPAMQRCLGTVAEIAGSEASVLVWGETGVGKELISRAIHRNSPRKERAFVVVDCAALPANLVENILFGHEKGAFTGAANRASGLLAQADGGTLFLDEVGELTLDIQRKLLRALQEHKFRPVGGGGEVASDFRVVAATNRDLDAMCQEGRFRPDLLYRLKGITVRVPPLRERGKDIKPIASTFCAELCERYGIPYKGFAPDFFESLEAHDWPGNVRELKNTIEWVLARALDQPTLFTAHLPTNLRAKLARESVGDMALSPFVQELHYYDDPTAVSGLALDQPDTDSQTLKDYRVMAAEAAERRYLQALLASHGGDPRRAQSVSGLSKARYYALLKKHGLSPEK
ncbi:MAG: sigma-54 dependent transcriptional regulator [Pseudomonadota bacterium]